MTPRQYFAGLAMHALLMRVNMTDTRSHDDGEDEAGTFRKLKQQKFDYDWFVPMDKPSLEEVGGWGWEHADAAWAIADLMLEQETQIHDENESATIPAAE